MVRYRCFVLCALVAAAGLVACGASGAAPSFPLTTTVEGAGAVARSPAGDAYEDGTRVTLTAEPAEGWRFERWGEGYEREGYEGSRTERTISVVVDRPRSLQAVFARVAQSGSDGPLPFLRVEGSRIVDEQGQPVVLRGVSFSDPNRLKKAGHWNRAYFEEAARWGATLVRFPVHPRDWRERGRQDYLGLIDQGLEWAGALGLYVVIDWHSIGNLRTEQFQDPRYETTQEETARFWKTIAARYKGNPVAAFYEIFNEPASSGGEWGELTWAQHASQMETLIDTVYAQDRGVIPLVGGLEWAYDLSGVRDRPVGRAGIGYVSHPYPQKREPPWPPKWQRAWGFVAEDYPVVVTEFGFVEAGEPGAHVPVIGDETYGNAITSFLEARGISWTAWVFDPVWGPPLFKDWETFEPTPQGHFFREKMRALNTQK